MVAVMRVAAIAVPTALAPQACCRRPRGTDLQRRALHAYFYLGYAHLVAPLGRSVLLLLSALATTRYPQVGTLAIQFGDASTFATEEIKFDGVSERVTERRCQLWAPQLSHGTKQRLNGSLDCI